MTYMTTATATLEVRLTSQAVLIQLMDLHGLTVRDLALKAGVSRAEVGHLRSGHRTRVKPCTAKAIASALGVPVAGLFIARVLPVDDYTHRLMEAS